MKIAMVSHLAYPYFIGGVEKYVYYISKELSKLGHDVEIYSTDPTGKYVGEKEVGGIPFHNFKSLAPNGIYYFSPKLFQALLKNLDAEIIHSNAYGTFAVLASIMSKRVNGIPTIVQPHLAAPRASKFFHKIYGPVFGTYIFNKCDKIILVSQAESDALPLLRKYQKKAITISNGVDFSKVNKFYNSSCSHKERFQLLCVSRLERMKGVDQAIHLMKKVQKKLPVSLTIVGDGPERAHLEQLSRESELKQQISFLGRVSEDRLYQIYSQADVFLSLSNYESNSISLIEAMSFGIVPIATNVGGNKYLIEDGKTGFLVSYPVNISEVKRKLETIANNFAFFSKLKVEIRKKALADFDIKKNAATLAQVYEHIASNV